MRLFFIKNTISLDFCRKQKLSSTVASFLVFLLGILQPLTPLIVSAQSTLQATTSQGILLEGETPPSSTAPSVSSSPPADVPLQEFHKKTYGQLMREFRIVQTGKVNGEALSDQERNERTTNLRGDFEAFLADEKKSLGVLSIFDSGKNAYVAQLETQIRALGGTATLFDRIVSFVQERVLGHDALPVKNILRESTTDDLVVPDNPSRFSFPSADALPVKKLSDPVSSEKNRSLIPEGLEDIITVTQVEAGEKPLPVFEDVSGDEAEVRITQEIQDLAARLGGNPVSIYNDLSSRLRYEPYYGAKKGAAGCLAESVCNDVDAASLSVALMRASGIPAHYKKSIIVVTPRNLKDLLGVEDVKAAFATLALKKIPIFTLSGVLDGKKLDEVDLSNEKGFAIEWVYPELYYEYDERGGNIPNMFSLEGVTTTAALQQHIANFPKKEWIPFDVIFSPLTHTKGDLVPPQVVFNIESFFSDYLKDARMISPLDAFSEAVQRLSGRNVLTDTRAHSTRLRTHVPLSVLPLSSPYLPAEGGTQNGTEIKMETWSRLPDERKASVTITLIESESKSTVFEKKFFGSSINNIPLSLVWRGASAADQELIDQYGGVHLAPATRVRIVPLLEGGKERHLGTQPVAIGQRLITRFSYAAGGQEVGSDEKFSIAGNQEGIFVSLSRVPSDPSHSTVQRILVEGQTGIARSYLLSVQEGSDVLAKIYDRVKSIDYLRTVVTQNRILSEVNGFPTTFDFSGLSIDASMQISDFSARGAYKENQKDYRRLLGLYGSHLERDVFEKITGLSSISTVKGLQLAYQKPETYQVHTIKSANASEIDSLQLSENTKSGMRDDVAKGWTVITPNKPIEDGTWKGVVYIALNPDGTGQYAIGEQTGANGGWTTDDMKIEDEYDENNVYLGSHVVMAVNSEENEKQLFLYKDIKKEVDSVFCRLSKTRFTDIQKDVEWERKYGIPCFEETRDFGISEHSYILASDGAKFMGTAGGAGRYGYWITRQEVRDILQRDKEKNNIENLNSITLDRTFKFNAVAGTYSWAGGFFDSQGTNFGWRSLTAYYQPLPDKKGRGVLAYGSILMKLEREHYNPSTIQCKSNDQFCDKRNWVLNILGFPTGYRSEADRYWPNFIDDIFRPKMAFYQNFAGGQVYIYGKDEYLIGNKKTFYVPTEIGVTYNSNEFCVNDKNGNKHCGSGGAYGFPIDDPELEADRVTVSQNFEIKRAIIAKLNQSAPPTFDYAIHYKCVGREQNSEFMTGKAFIEGLYDTGNEELKSALIFVGIPLAAGATIDLIFGTHGGAGVALAATTGGFILYSLNALAQADIDTILASVEDKYASEIRSAQCNSRKAYLLARHAPGFIFFAFTAKDFVKKGAKQAREMAVTKALVLAAAKKIPKIADLPKLFNKRIQFFELLPSWGKNQVQALQNKAYQEFIDELTKETFRKGVVLSDDRIAQIVANRFSEKSVIDWFLRKYALDFKLSNRSPGDKEPHSKLIRGDGLKFKTKNGTIVDGDGNPLFPTRADSGPPSFGQTEVLVVIRDGQLYYGRARWVDANGNKQTASHASLVEGKDVDGAFTLYFEGPRLVSYNNQSGHYTTQYPRLPILEYAFQKSKVDLGNASKYNYYGPGPYDAFRSPVYQNFSADFD